MIASCILRCKQKAKGCYAPDMEIERTAREIDKAQIDTAPPGAMTISIHSSARCPDPAAVAESLLCLVHRVQSEHDLLLIPLRLILVTGNLGEAVSSWQRALGLPEAGVSKQTEGVAVGKHMSWGTDRESARSVIILTDGIAAAIAANEPLAVAIATVVHELAHVHDDFARGLACGFPLPQAPLHLGDWPRICACVAEITWSEYAAESLAMGYLTPEDLESFARNDPAYLAGVHTRLRQLVISYKVGQVGLPSLWSRCVTDMSDLFAHFGRAAARLPYDQNEDEASDRLVGPIGEAACWKPVIKRLVHELQELGAKNYTEWGAEPFCGLGGLIAPAVEAVGFFPTYNGNNLHVKVR